MSWIIIAFIILLVCLVAKSNKNSGKKDQELFVNQGSARRFDDSYNPFQDKGPSAEDFDKRLAALRKSNREFEKKLAIAVNLNNKGAELEKKGEIEEAISVYLENLNSEYKTPFPYERLMILYRKRKEYQSEYNICIQAIHAFPKEKKFSDRLEKIKLLLNKTIQK